MDFDGNSHRVTTGHQQRCWIHFLPGRILSKGIFKTTAKTHNNKKSEAICDSPVKNIFIHKIIPYSFSSYNNHVGLLQVQLNV
jgi:hypothetical protein